MRTLRRSVQSQLILRFQYITSCVLRYITCILLCATNNSTLLRFFTNILIPDNSRRLNEHTTSFVYFRLCHKIIVFYQSWCNKSIYLRKSFYFKLTHNGIVKAEQENLLSRKRDSGDCAMWCGADDPLAIKAVSFNRATRPNEIRRGRPSASCGPAPRLRVLSDMKLNQAGMSHGIFFR